MATYGLPLYGSTLYGGGSRAPFAPPGEFGGGLSPNGPFQVLARPVTHGAIEVDWIPTSDTTLSLVRLVRSTTGYPVAQDDGEVLLDLASITTQVNYTDIDIRPGTRYYYGLFAFSSVLQTWLAAGTTNALATLDVDTGRTMYGRIPTMYREADAAAGSMLLDRFTGMLGYQLDVLRSEALSLATIADPARGHALGTQWALQQYGLRPEPELGWSAQRSLLALATTLYQSKGTPECARLLSQAITGWAAAVFPGPNLMLDDLDSTGWGSAGRWTASAGTLAWRAGDGTVNAPQGTGMIDLTNASGAAIASFVPTSGLTALLQGIPVTPGVHYNAQCNVRGTAVAGALLQMDWYDTAGAPISSVIGATVTPNVGDWVKTPVAAGNAPGGAVRLGLTVKSGILTTGQHMYASGFTATLDPAPTAWSPARQTLISLRANTVNEIGNPRFAIDTSSWTTAAVTGIIGAGGTLARITGTDGPPPAPTTYGRLTATATMHGASITSIYSLSTERLYTATVWVRSSVASAIYLSSADPLVTPAFVNVPGDGTWHDINVPLVTAAAFVKLTISVVAANAGTVDFGAVMLSQGDPVTYFDGSVPSSTADYVWEGAPHASRSHYYRQRTVRTARLRSVLPDFLPPSLQFQLLFAQPPSLSPGSYGIGPYGSGSYGIGG